MIKTVGEAIEIFRNTYKKDRKYTMRNEETGEIWTGTAYEIYGKVSFDDFLSNGSQWYAADENDKETCAFVEVMYCAIDAHPPIEYDWEREAIDLMNRVIADIEDN